MEQLTWFGAFGPTFAPLLMVFIAISEGEEQRDEWRFRPVQ